MGAEAEPAVAALAEALCSLPATGESDTLDSVAASAAAEALAKIGRPAVPALAKALHHGSEDVRACAVAALGEIGSAAAAAAPDLKQLLAAEKSDRVLWRAREVYAVAEPDKKEVVRLLSPFLRDRDCRVRSHMAVLLGNLGPKAAAAVTPLMDGLNDNGWTRSSRLDPNFGINRPVCCDMAEALGKIGDAARPALPKLSAMMTDDQRPTVRISAALAVFQIDPPNQKALRELIRILEEDPEGTGALEAVVALADVGPRGRDAVPALGKALRHEEYWVRAFAANDLGNIGGAEAVPFLIFACRDPSEMVRWSAVGALSNMGAAAAPAVPALIQLLETVDADEEWLDPYPIDVVTIEALGTIGPAAASAIPVLEEASQSKEQYVREAAVAALEKIRPASAGARPAKVEAAVPQSEEAAAIDRIEKCGARVTVDKSQSGQLSVSVEFWDYWPSAGPRGDLDAARSRHNEALAHLKRLPQVRSLRLSRIWTSDAGLAHLKGLTGLQSLDLSRTRITNAGLAQLRGLTGLQSLNLTRTRITDAGLVHLKGLAQLQSLDLSGTKVTGPGLENLAGMTRLRKLMLAGRTPWVELGEAVEMLEAGKWDLWSPLDDAALRHLRGLPNLQTLDLSRRTISDAGLAYVGQLKGLESLNLWNGGQAWVRKRGIPCPSVLDGITDAGLAHLRELQSLQSLDLGGRSITDAGVPHLNRLRSLRKLRLEGTLITEAGATSLRQALPKATIEIDLFTEATVREIENLGGRITRDEDRPDKPVIGIDLSKARIGDADAATVAKLPALETLDLSETEVTDAGLVHLQGLRQLRELDLRDTKATDTGIKTLQRALPECNIRR
jgi:HEAT repeat protein/Leucine-rich repeat (LRR) protein